MERGEFLVGVSGAVQIESDAKKVFPIESEIDVRVVFESSH